jgi:hypothetical protein
VIFIVLSPSRNKKPIRMRAPIKCITCSLKGKSTFHIGGESQELDEQMIVRAPSEVEHGVVNTSTKRLVVLDSAEAIISQCWWSQIEYGA